MTTWSSQVLAITIIIIIILIVIVIVIIIMTFTHRRRHHHHCHHHHHHHHHDDGFHFTSGKVGKGLTKSSRAESSPCRLRTCHQRSRQGLALAARGASAPCLRWPRLIRAALVGAEPAARFLGQEKHGYGQPDADKTDASDSPRRGSVLASLLSGSGISAASPSTSSQGNQAAGMSCCSGEMVRWLTAAVHDRQVDYDGFTAIGDKDENQDEWIVKDLGPKEGLFYVRKRVAELDFAHHKDSSQGVFDGHGQYGRHFALFAKEQFLPTLRAHPKYLTELEVCLSVHMRIANRAHLAMIVHRLHSRPRFWSSKKRFVERQVSAETASSHMRAQLATYSTAAFSGTTATVCIQRGLRLYMAHAGDSRAVLGRMGSNQQLEAVVLTADHQADDPSEAERCRKAGARIEPLRYDCVCVCVCVCDDVQAVRRLLFHSEHSGAYIGPARVWKGDAQYPGQCVTRTLGDTVAQTIGVTPEPDIKVRLCASSTHVLKLTHIGTKVFDLTQEDRVVVIASDGVWDGLESLECLRIAMRSAPDAHQAAQIVVHEALKVGAGLCARVARRCSYITTGSRARGHRRQRDCCDHLLFVHVVPCSLPFPLPLRVIACIASPAGDAVSRTLV
jgi:serine/threonine protein phosphatase PrpC